MESSSISGACNASSAGVDGGDSVDGSSAHCEFRLLQAIWDLRKGREDVLSSSLFPIVTSLVFYVLCVLPFMIIDMYGKNWKWIQKYKIQPDMEVTWTQIRLATTLTAWNHLLYILPVTIAQFVWTPSTAMPHLAPTVFEFVWQQYLALVIFDLEYALWHVVHHKVRFLYRHVHSIHHQFSSPSSWVTEYLHPWELISIGVFTTTSPWWFSGVHPMTQWSFLLVSIMVSVDDHCGYDLPMLPHHWLPFWGGSIHHDMHHHKPLTNFQPFFTWWDRLFGSFCPGKRAGGYKPETLVEWEKIPRIHETEFGCADSHRIHLNNNNKQL